MACSLIESIIPTLCFLSDEVVPNITAICQTQTNEMDREFFILQTALGMKADGKIMRCTVIMGNIVSKMYNF